MNNRITGQYNNRVFTKLTNTSGYYRGFPTQIKMPIKAEVLVHFENPFQGRRSENCALDNSKFDTASSDTLLKVDHKSLEP